MSYASDDARDRVNEHQALRQDEPVLLCIQYQDSYGVLLVDFLYKIWRGHVQVFLCRACVLHKLALHIWWESIAASPHALRRRLLIEVSTQSLIGIYAVHIYGVQRGTIPSCCLPLRISLDSGFECD